MKKQILFLALILASILILSCNKSGDPVPTKPILTEAISELTAESTFEESTPTPTSLPRIITVTIDPTFLPHEKKILKGSFKQICIDVDSKVPDYNNINGGFVLYNRSKEIPYIQTLPLNHSVGLPIAEPYSIKLSPSGKWIAYLQDTTPRQYNFRLIVQSMDGRIQETLAPETIGDVTGISGWLNDESIVLELFSAQPRSTLIIVNPFTGNRQELVPSYPNIYKNGTWKWDSSGLTIYSPDLRYVIYPVHYDNTPPRYIVWDIQSRREIAAILTGDLIQKPQWAETGKVVVVTVDTSYTSFSASEFYGTDIDGTVVQMSKLGELFPGVKTKIRSWSWSPDSSRIAFWLDFYQEGSISEERLMVLDTETGDIADYCIQGDQIQVATDQLVYTPPPIWSPDGGSLLIENRYKINESRLILFELDNNTAYELAQNISPLGWTINKP